MKIAVIIVLCYLSLLSNAQEILVVNKKPINVHQFLMAEPILIKSDSIQFKTPKYIQGFFCNFEDQLNRKKVPIDFSLGNSKY